MSRSVISESTFSRNRLSAFEYTTGGAVVSSGSDRFILCSFDYTGTDDPLDSPYWKQVSAGPQLCDPSPGPCQIKYIEPFVFPVAADTQEGFLDLSEVFNHEAVAFELESVEPPGRFGVNLIGGELSLTGVSQGSLETTIVTVAAFDGTDWATLPVTIHIRADRLYVQSGAPAGGDGLSWESAFSSLQDALESLKPRNRCE